MRRIPQERIGGERAFGERRRFLNTKSVRYQREGMDRANWALLPPPCQSHIRLQLVAASLERGSGHLIFGQSGLSSAAAVVMSGLAFSSGNGRVNVSPGEGEVWPDAAPFRS